MSMADDPLHRSLPALPSPRGLTAYLRHRARQDRLPLPHPLPHALLPPSHAIRLGFHLIPSGTRLVEQPLYYRADHAKGLITIAPTRSGKATCQLAYELTGHGGRINGVAPSVVINDKKAELIRLCARARVLLGDVPCKYDPFGMVQDMPYVTDIRLNPLDRLTPHDVTEFMILADGLLVMEGKEPHFIYRARDLLAGLMAHVCDDSHNAPADLPSLMTILQSTPDAFQAKMEVLTEHSAIPFVRRTLASFCDNSREVRGVVSTALGQLKFLSDPQIARSLSGTGAFRLADLKQGGIALFCCLPEKQAVAFPRLLRLFWTSVLSAMYQFPVHPVLCVIDEASSSLGDSMELFETAFALGAGYGLRIHLLYQNIAQLRKQFQEQAESILSSAGVVQYFRPNDLTTAKAMVERAGNHTVTILNESTSFNTTENRSDTGRSTSQSMNTSYSFQHYDRPIWTVQEVLDMADDKQVLYIDGIGGPVVACRKPYWQSAWYPDRFDANPYVPHGY